VLIALYENETPFEPRLVDLSDPGQREALTKLWPLMKFPLLVDDHSGRVVPESSIIIEYVSQRYPGRIELIPQDPDVALEARLQDRFFDLQIHEPMQKHVGDKLRPAAERDPHGVQQAHAQIERAYDMLEQALNGRSWAAGNTFTLADCAAAPALYYADRIHPITQARPRLAAYLQKLHARPSFARAFQEAQPYLHLFPG